MNNFYKKYLKYKKKYIQLQNDNIYYKKYMKYKKKYIYLQINEDINKKNENKNISMSIDKYEYKNKYKLVSENKDRLASENKDRLASENKDRLASENKDQLAGGNNFNIIYINSEYKEYKNNFINILKDLKENIFL